jgi:hypothetical protein
LGLGTVVWIAASPVGGGLITPLSGADSLPLGFVVGGAASVTVELATITSKRRANKAAVEVSSGANCVSLANLEALAPADDMQISTRPKCWRQNPRSSSIVPFEMAGVHF